MSEITLPATDPTDNPGVTVYVNKAISDRHALELTNNMLQEIPLWRVLEDPIFALEALYETLHDTEMEMPVERVAFLLKPILATMRYQAYQFRDAIDQHLGRVALLVTDELAALPRVLAVQVGDDPLPQLGELLEEF